MLKGDLRNVKGAIGTKNIIALILLWCFLLGIFAKVDYYSKARKLEERNFSFITGELYREESRKEDKYISNVASLVFRLLNSPNVEEIEADNKQALSYMTQSMAKRNRSYLEWRVEGIKRFRQLNKNATSYLLQELKAEIVRDLPEVINKPLLKEGERYVLVEATMKAFDGDGKEIHSKPIRGLLGLIKVKPTVEKPSHWLVDSIVLLED